MIAAIVLCAGLWVAAIVIIWTAELAERRTEAQLAALDEQAADWGEPTRAEVEAAYGPLIAYGPAETPIYTETAAYLLRAELDDDEAVGRWLA